MCVMLACVDRWLDTTEGSGMAVTEVNALSGYVIDIDRFRRQHESMAVIMRSEINARGALAIYFDEVSSRRSTLEAHSPSTSMRSVLRGQRSWRAHHLLR